MVQVTDTPVQQAFILQQRLTEVNHLDHTLITYPNLGHIFNPSSLLSRGTGPIEEYVLADLYAWLEAHSVHGLRLILDLHVFRLLCPHPTLLRPH